MLVVNGQIRGTWQVLLKNKKTDVTTTLFTGIPPTRQAEVKEAVKRYMSFYGNETAE